MADANTVYRGQGQAKCYLITTQILLAMLVEMTSPERHLERSENSPAVKRFLAED